MIESQSCTSDDLKTGKDNKSEVTIFEITDDKEHTEEEKKTEEKESDKKENKSKLIIEGNLSTYSLISLKTCNVFC